MPKLEKYEVANRGFFGYSFIDLYGYGCSIQESSLATEKSIWLGVSTSPDGKDINERMHLNREMAKQLVIKLNKFIRTGKL